MAPSLDNPYRVHRRRLRRRRRHAGRAAGGSRPPRACSSRPAEIRAQLAGGDPVAAATRSDCRTTTTSRRFTRFASENDALAWNFFVRHYDRRRAAAARPEVRRGRTAGRDVGRHLYPRAGTLGGCTAHNAMIFVYPHNADWDDIAAADRRRSWSASTMRKYFERLENCRHRPIHRWLARLGINPTRHGWHGWLPDRKRRSRSRRSPGSPLCARRHRQRASPHSSTAPNRGSACAGSCGAVRSERLAAGEGQRHGHPLPAADHRPPPPQRHARARARRRAPPSGSPDDQC